LTAARLKNGTQREAAEPMGVTERRVRKLLRRMKKQEDAVVVHRLRGQACNRKLPAKTKKQALAILRKFGWLLGGKRRPKIVPVRLRIQVGKETLRGRMIEAGMRQANSCRPPGEDSRSALSWIR